jgi:tetratricopeptide (TPR) repeat protein
MTRSLLVFVAGLAILGGTPASSQTRNVDRTVSLDRRIALAEADLSGSIVDARLKARIDVIDLYLQKARLYRAMWESAVQCQSVYYSELIKNNQEDSQARFMLALCHFERRDFAKAMEHLKVFLGGANLSREDRTRGRIWLGAVQSVLGQEETARQTWRSLDVKGAELGLELQYVQHRVNEPRVRWDRVDIPQGAQLTSWMRRSLLYRAADQGDAETARTLLRDPQIGSPAYIVKRGTISERRYYDPAVLDGIVRASLTLMADQARSADSIGRLSGQSVQNRGYYEGIAQFERGRWEEARRALAVLDAPEAMLYLWASCTRLGDKQKAEELRTRIEALHRPELTSELGVLGSTITPESKTWAEMCFGALASVRDQKASKKRTPPLMYTNLVITLFRAGRHEDAVRMFSEGFRWDAEDDLYLNDPKMTMTYVASLVAARNFRSLSDATRAMIPVVASYPLSMHIAEAVTGLDILTAIGTQGSPGVSR